MKYEQKSFSCLLLPVFFLFFMSGCADKPVSIQPTPGFGEMTQEKRDAGQVTDPISDSQLSEVSSGECSHVEMADPFIEGRE